MATLSEITLCNMALSEIGARRTISSFDERTTEAAQCALWYNPLKEALLREAPWAFARRQESLTLLGQQQNTDGIPTSPWPSLYKYAYPEDCLKFRYVITPPASGIFGETTPPAVPIGPQGPILAAPSRECRYVVNNDVDADTGEVTKTILSNVPNAIGCYTMNLSSPAMFDSQFVIALQCALSYKLVIPITGNAGMRADFKQAANEIIMKARATDANESITSSDHAVDWITTREIGGAWGAYGPSGPGGYQWGQWNDSYSGFGWSM